MADNKKIVDVQTARLFGSDYVRVLTALLKKEGKSASGALINSLDYRIQETAQDISIIIQANEYLQFVDRGRKPGKYPPIQAISKWASLKGISQDAVFPIARSIYKFGIKPTNVIQRTNNEFFNSQTFANKYMNKISTNIEDIVFNIVETELINKNNNG
jgi:hypothetical protein